MTAARPDRREWRDLVLAWRVCGRTTSNAIVLVTGARRWASAPASSPGWWRPRSRWPRPARRAAGGAGASDAFFPFPDGLEVLAKAGVTAVVQPGGSVRDGEVIAAADAAGMTMVTTGERHFRH